MEFNWEDFKNGKCAVHCKTKEEAKKFIKECYKHEMKWCYSDENTTHWEDVSKRNYYVCDSYNIYYGDLNWKPNELPVVEYKKDNKMKLKEGMIVECRNGNRYLLRKNLNELTLICSNFGAWFQAIYDEELNENEYHKEDFDIMKIYKSKAYALEDLFNDNYLECIWERKEPKKMTLAQISEALGYEVEVIDNE